MAWSFSLLVKDLFDCYEAACEGLAVDQPQPRPYGDYIAYLQNLDLSEAEAFWRRTLKGFTTPTPLAGRVPGNAPAATAGSSYSQQRIELSVALTNALQALGRQHQLTLNTIVQGAWALLLSRYAGEAEVLFGCAVAGRPGDLPGIESMIGSFNNFLPTRVVVTPNAPLLDWLRAFQRDQVEQRRYELTPLVLIKAWSEVPADRLLFDTYLTFENFPIDPSLAARSERLLQATTGATQTEHVMRVTVWPLRQLTLYMSYYRRCFDDATVGRMLHDFRSLLERVAADPGQRLGSLLRQVETT